MAKTYKQILKETNTSYGGYVNKKKKSFDEILKSNYDFNDVKKELESSIRLDTFESDLKNVGTTVNDIYKGWQPQDTMTNTRSTVESMKERVNAFQEYQKLFGGENAVDVSDLAKSYNTVLEDWDSLTETYGKYKDADSFNAYKTNALKSIEDHDNEIKTLDKQIAHLKKEKEIYDNAYTSNGGYFPSSSNRPAFGDVKPYKEWQTKSTDYERQIKELEDKKAEQQRFYDDKKALKEQEELNKKHAEMAKSQEGIAGFEKYLADEEAAAKSKKEMTNGDHFAYAMRTTGHDSMSTAINSAIYSYQTDDSYKKPTEKWTEKQKNIFGAYYNPDSPYYDIDKAYEYAIGVNNQIAEKKVNKEKADIVDSATDNFWSGAAHTAGAVLTAPFGLADFMDNLAEHSARGTITQKSSLTPFDYSQTVTEGISTELNENFGTLNGDIPVIGGKGWGDVYGLGTSIAQSAVSANTLGGAGTFVSYFGQAAAAGVDDALSRGATEEQAIVYGTILGAAEGISENIGAEKLLKLGSANEIQKILLKGFKKGGAKEFFKLLNKQGMAEGLEETFSSFVGQVADNFVLQDKSRFNAMVKEYMASGMSEDEATQKAWIESIESIAYDTLGGYISGGVHAGPQIGIGLIKQNAENKKQGQAIRENERVDDVLNIASMTSQESETYKAYTEYAKRGVDAKNITDAQLGNLYGIAENDAIASVSLKNVTKEQKADAETTYNRLSKTKTKNTAAKVTNTLSQNEGKESGESILTEREMVINDIADGMKQESEAKANLFRLVDDGRSNAGDYADSFNLVVDLARNDFSQDYILEHRGVLSTAQVSSIYQSVITNPKMAQQKRLNDLIQEQGDNLEIKGTIDDSVIDYNNSNAEGKVNWNDLHQNVRGTIAYISGFASKVAGMDVQLVTNGRDYGFTGMYDRHGNTMLIDITALTESRLSSPDEKGRKDNSKFVISTVAHEVTHWMEEKAPELYAQYDKMVMDALTSGGLSEADVIGRRLNLLQKAENKRAEKENRKPREITEKDARREVIARASEDMLALSEEGKKFFESLTENEQKQFVDKIKEVIQNIKDWINNVLSKLTSSAPEAQDLRALAKDIDAISKKWDEMLRQSAKVNAAMKKAGIKDKAVVESKEDIDTQKADIDTYAEEQYNNWESYELTDEFLAKVPYYDRHTFLRSLANKTSDLKQGEQKNIVIRTGGHIYLYAATGYMNGSIENVYKPNEITNEEIKAWRYLNGSIDTSTTTLNSMAQSYESRRRRDDWDNVVNEHSGKTGQIDDVDEQERGGNSLGYFRESDGDFSSDEKLIPGSFVYEDGHAFKVNDDGTTEDIQFSDIDDDIQTAINQSMTMAQAKDMIQRAFVLNGIKDWYEDQYKNGDEWLAGEGANEVANYIENTYEVYEKYIGSKHQGIVDGDWFVEDIVDAYVNKTLTGKVKEKTQWMDLSNNVAVADKRFYAPREIKSAKKKLEIAKQRLTNDNRATVTKARAEILLYAHNKGAAETLGLTESELKKMLRKWGGYSASAREISMRFNNNVANSNRWVGIENCSWLKSAQVSEKELARLVNSIEGDSRGFERNYIARTMLALDTHIDWSEIKFVFTGVVDPNRRSVKGLYDNRTRTVTASYGSQNTVAHEMGHALDYKWARDLGFSENAFLTDQYLSASQIKTEEQKLWYSHFKDFISDLTDKADLTSEYTMRNQEVFARFVASFVEWVDKTATGRASYGYTGFKDRFTGSDYISFVKLLQEKAMIDSKSMVAEKDVQYSDIDAEDYAPTFYSKMEKTIDEIKNAKMGAASVVSYLKGKGVKAEEIKWSGIETFLEGKKSLTKEELQEFVKGSQLQIEETVLDNKPIDGVELRKVSKRKYDLYIGNQKADTYTGNWKGNYWTGDKDSSIFSSEKELLEKAVRKYKNSSRWDSYSIYGGDNYRELLFSIPNSDYTNEAMETHWGNNKKGVLDYAKKGVLAHARIQDIDVDGKKMLFIEEIQSDWHNQGHKEGYVEKGTRAADDIRNESADAFREFYQSDIISSIESRLTKNGYADTTNLISNLFEGEQGAYYTLVSEIGKLNPEEKSFIEKTVREELKRKKELEVADKVSDKAAPDAPFRDNYHEYVLKRLIRMAAEGDYDSIGWTPADIQSRRWSDEFAEGYRIEYDQDIPKFLRKYGKQWGASVGSTILPHGGEISYVDENGEHYSSYREWSYKSLKALREKYGESIIDNITQERKGNEWRTVNIKTGEVYNTLKTQELGTEVWSMDITDSMRDSVLYEGQVMYSDIDEATLDDLNAQLREKQNQIHSATMELKKFDSKTAENKLYAVLEKKDSSKEELDKAIQEYNKWSTESGYADVVERQSALKDEEKTLRREIQKVEDRLHEELKEQISHFSDEDVKKYVSKAVRKYHTTSRLENASYLLTTGSMLDFSDGQGYRVKDHREISEILDLPDYAEYSDGMIAFMNMGNIRLQTYGIDVSAMPNDKQFSTLRDIIFKVMRNNDEFTVDFSHTNGYSAGSVTYNKGTSTSKIVADIKNFFENGVVPEEQSSIRDFLYSDIDPEVDIYELLGENKRLQKENEKLNEDFNRLQERLKLERQVTGGTTFNRNQLDAVAGHIRKLANSNYSKAELVKQINDVYTYVATSKELTWEDLFARLYGISKTVLKESKPLKVGEDDYFKTVLHEIRNQKISLSDVQKQELKSAYGTSWNKVVFGKLNVSNDATMDLDSQWSVWASEHPGLFDAETTEGDQIIKLLEIYDDLRDGSETYETLNNEDMIRWLANEIYNQYWNVSNVKTTADKYDRKIKLLNFNHRKAMKELRDNHNKRLEKQKLADTIYYNSIIEKIRRRKNEEIQEVRKLGKERMDKYKEEAARKTRIQSITSQALTLNEMLIKNSKDKHIHESLKGPVTNLLQAIDFSSKQLLGMRGGENKGTPTRKDISLANALSKVQKMMADANVGKEELVELYGHDLDADIESMMNSVESIMQTVGDNEFVLNKMTLNDLITLDNIVKTVKHAVTKMNKFHVVHHAQGISNLAQETIIETDELGKAKIFNPEKLKGRAQKLLNWRNIVPYYAFKRFGNSGKKIFEAFQDGWDKLAFNVKEIIDFTNETYDAKDVRAWEEELHTFNLRMPATEEEMASPVYEPQYQEVQMTTAQIMHLYLLNMRPAAKAHLFGGGIRVADIETKKGKVISQTEGIIFEQSEIDTIIKTLTPEQKKVANALSKFMNTTSSDWGNEVSMARFGYKAFTEENYVPIQADKNNLAVDDETEKGNSLFKLLNMSFTKSLVDNANNRIVISSLFDVFAQHTSDMAKYNALALPVLDAFRWFNYKEKGHKGEQAFITKSVKTSIEKAFGKDGQSYITTFLKDINGQENVTRDTIGSGFFKNAKIASVGANIRVALLQPTAYLKASANIDNKYLVRALFHKPKIAKAEKYCGIALWKSMGYFDTNVQRGVAEQIKHAETKTDKMVEWSMKGAEWGDKFTFGYLWNASELEVRDKRKDLKVGSEEFFNEVGKRLRDVIYSTQVVDSTLTRSEMMRSSDGWDKMLTVFASEPTLAYNMVQDAYMEMSLEARRLKQAGEKHSKKKAFAKHGKRMARVLVAYTTTNIVAALIESGFDVLRDDEEEEMNLAEFMKLYLQNFADNQMISTKIPYLKEAVSIAQGFTSTRTDTQWMASFSNALRQVYKLYEGDGNPVKLIKNVLQTFSYFSGLPFYNAYRDFMATLDKTEILTTEDFEELLNEFID